MYTYMLHMVTILAAHFMVHTWQQVVLYDKDRITFTVVGLTRLDKTIPPASFSHLHPVLFVTCPP